MKADTRAFYEAAVERAIRRIRAALDASLDLTDLAREAALSPFHFHRIFRGLTGETPLEMHRRLRLERAARALIDGAAPVTVIALDAGYETHEAFTRAFRQAYGVAPSAFRHGAAVPGPGCVEGPRVELAAASGVHAAGVLTTILFLKREAVMDVIIEEKPELRVATVRHVGPYMAIGEAFARLGAIAGPAGLIRPPETLMLAIYHDDPEVVPADELTSDAGVTVPADAPLPEGLGEARLPAGRYARMTHVGPYTGLGDAWTRLMGQWLPASGQRVGAGVAYEVYRNTPETAPPEKLETDLYLHLA